MDFNYLKRRSIFDAPQASTGIRNFQFPDPEPQPQPQPDDLTSTYGKIAGMETGPAQQKYRSFIDSAMPNRADYEHPGKMARLGAILSGVGESVKNSPAAGFKTTKAILDDPYNTAMDDFKMQAAKLGESANLEEKDINNRVKTYRDWVQDQRNAKEDARHKILDDNTIANTQSQIKDRDRRAAQDGWTKTTDKNTGIESYTRIGADGQLETRSIGKMDRSFKEADDSKVGVAKRESDITFGNNMALAAERGRQTRLTQGEKFDSIQKLNEWKNENKAYQFKEAGDGTIWALHPTDPSASFSTGIEGSRLTLDQRKELKLTVPTTETESTTEIGADGKSKRTRTKKGPVNTADPNAPPAGAKAGGKWINTKYGRVYQEP